MKEASKQFFFEPCRRPDSDYAARAASSSGREKQKTSAPLRACVAPALPQRGNQSFFASFCSQKEVLASFSEATS
jgi:hypothetical protein